VIDAVLDIAAAVLLVLGGLLSLAAGVGLLRFRDALSRLHAGTKPQILGLICVVAAVALSARSWTVLLLLAPVVVFQLLTSPTAAQMVGRAGYRTDNHRRELLVADELEGAVDRAAGEEHGPSASAPPRR
jgi:multicomponent Na+:H+ antiporter subunit G